MIETNEVNLRGHNIHVFQRGICVPTHARYCARSTNIPVWDHVTFENFLNGTLP